MCFLSNKVTNICGLIIKKNAKVFFAQVSLCVPITFTLCMIERLRSILQGGAELLKGQVVQKSKW